MVNSNKQKSKKAKSKAATKKKTATKKKAAKKTTTTAKTATKKAAKKKATKAAASKKKAAKKKASKKTATRPAAKKKAAKKKAAKKAAVKKTAKKAAVKKAAKKTAAKKTAAKKAAKKAAVKKAAKKTATKKATKKAATKKTATKKAAKKAAAKQPASKKAAKKTAAKKVAKKAASKKPAQRSAQLPVRRPQASGPETPEVLAARRFYALPVNLDVLAAVSEDLTDQGTEDLVAAHLGRNFGYFGAIDKTLSGFVVLDDDGDNYYLADLRDGGQVYWQDHETREVSLAFDTVADYAGYQEARKAAQELEDSEGSDDDDDIEVEDDDAIAARFRPRKLRLRASLRPATAQLLERYQWLMWLFARSHEAGGQAIDDDEDMAQRAFGHLRRAFPTVDAEAKAFAAESQRLADDPHLGIYWLLHTSVLADHPRRDEVVQTLAGSEHPLVQAFVAAFGQLGHNGDIPAAPGFRARRSLILLYTGGGFGGDAVDLERLIAALVADPVGHGYAKAQRVVDAAIEADALDRLHALAEAYPGPELGLQALAALLDVRAGRESSSAADAVLKDTLDHADIHVQAAALEDLHTLASDRDVVRALVDAVLARDPYHWGTLHAGKEAAERDGDAARAEALAERIAPLAEVRPVMLQLVGDDDAARAQALEVFRALGPAQRLLLARRLIAMAEDLEPEALAAAIEALLAAGDPEALAELQSTAVKLSDPSGFAEQLGELREGGFADLDDPLLPVVKALLLRPESGEFLADTWKEDLVEKLAPIAHEPQVFDRLLDALAEDSRHALRDAILSKLFIAYDDNEVVARLSDEQADRLVRLAAGLNVKPGADAGDDDDDDDDDDGRFPGIHVYYAAGRVLFYFTHPGAVPALAELLADATDQELLGNLYNALQHIKTEAALAELRGRLFGEQRQIWNLCNSLAETFSDDAHAEVMAALERTPSDHAANSYASVFLDFADDTKKKPHDYVAAIARLVLGWPLPDDARARAQRKFVLMHAARLALESGDHELVRQAHAAAAAIAEAPFSNLSELHYGKDTEDPWQSLKARERKQLDKVLASQPAADAAPRKLDAPVRDIDDDGLAELAGVPIDRRFLTTAAGEVWFFDKQGKLLVFDGLEVAAPKFTFTSELGDLGAFLAAAERCDGHVVHWSRDAGEFRDIARYGDRVLVFEGVNNGRFAGLGFVADSPAAAAELYAKLVDHPLPGWSVAGAWYVPQRGGVQRTYYAPLPDGGYNDKRDELHELRDDPEALAAVEAQALALLKRPGAQVACIEWMERLRRPEDMGLLEYLKDRAREDDQSPAWHLQAFAEYERLLSEWGWQDAVPGLSVRRGGPVDAGAIARFEDATGVEAPAPLRAAWTEHGPLSWRIDGRGLSFLGPDEALARAPEIAEAAEALAATLSPDKAEWLRNLMYCAQVLIEDEQRRPVVLFVPSRDNGRPFVRYDVASPPDDLWFVQSFAWHIAVDLGEPFVDALADALPDLRGLPYGARRHDGVVRRSYRRDGEFWDIVFDPEAAFVLTRAGKLGAEGSDHLRRFTDADQARAELDRLVAEKKAAGYALAD